MGSTHVIHLIIDWLYDLKVNKGYNIFDLIRYFEKCLEDWDRITVFISKEMSQQQIRTKIDHFIKREYTFFFVFALGYDAVTHTQLMISQLIKEDFFRTNYYLPTSFNNYIGDLPSYFCYGQYWKER